jgi:hypothetical protein
MTRRLVPVLVVALVVLAGCTGPSTPASDTEATGNGTTAGGIDATTDDTAGNATGPLERGPTPPGVAANATGGGVVANASALLAAHERVLAANGFEATRSSTVAVGDGPTRNSTAVVVAGPALTRYHSRTTVARENGTATYDVWQNETTGFVRTTVDGNTSYQRFDTGVDGSDLTRPPALEGVLEDDDVQFSVANVTTEDGRRVFTLTATATVENESADATNDTYTARIVVDERGVISAYHVRQDLAARDVTHEWTLESLDVTPTRPDWVANATDRTRRNETVDAARTAAVEGVSGWR